MAARKITMASPRFFHTKSRITGTRMAEPSSQETRSTPMSVKNRLIGPP